MRSIPESCVRIWTQLKFSSLAFFLSSRLDYLRVGKRCPQIRTSRRRWIQSRQFIAHQIYCAAGTLCAHWEIQRRQHRRFGHIHTIHQRTVSPPQRFSIFFNFNFLNSNFCFSICFDDIILFSMTTGFVRPQNVQTSRCAVAGHVWRHTAHDTGAHGNPLYN